jgi:hypothetical protein
MRKPIGVTVPYRAPTPEDEAFNEIERRSKVKQTLIAESKPTIDTLTEAVRTLTARVEELEKK